MAKPRCIYCEMPEGDGHSVRCAVTKSSAPAVYEENEHEIRAERDRYRQALERCQRELDRREQTLRDTSHQLSRAGAALLDAAAEISRLRQALETIKIRLANQPDWPGLAWAIGNDISKALAVTEDGRDG